MALRAAALSVLASTMIPAAVAAFGPADKLSTLRGHPDEVYPFIVRWTSGATLADVLPAGTDVSAATDLPLIRGAALPLRVGTALALADHPQVLQVWYLHPELAPLYVRVIQALDYNVRTLELPTLVNISLGPPPRFWSTVPQPDEPMHAATRAAAEAGLIPVMAIGNSGEGPGDRAGLVNPWCWPPWVISVGAYDGAAARVAPFSSRGHPDRRETWPDVVAQGVDVIGPFPTHLKKSEQRRRRDEANAAFLAEVPADKRALFTLESGTSQAAANVTGAAAQVLFFLRETITRAGVAADRPLFELTIAPERANPALAAMPRLTGTVRTLADGSTVYAYPLDLPWKMVAQLLRDSAIALPGVPPAQGGAGLVDRGTINTQFGTYGLISPKIAPSKVVE